jgi:hypothetical protein
VPDEVFHLLTPELPGVETHDKANRIDKVTFTAAIRANDTGEIPERPAGQLGSVRSWDHHDEP